MTYAANHNRTDTDTQKHARRLLLVERLKKAGIKRPEFFTFSGMMGTDAQLFRTHFPKSSVLSLEKSENAYHQRDRRVFNDPAIVMVLTSLKTFLQGGRMRHGVPQGPADAQYTPITFMPQEEQQRLQSRTFSAAYLDYVKKADHETLHEVKEFLERKVTPKFVVAVANSGKNADSFFDRYEAIAAHVGATFMRDDYCDYSPMNFAIIERL